MTLKQSNSKFLLMNFNDLGGKMFYINELKRAEKRLAKLEEKRGNNCISVILVFRNGRTRTLKTNYKGEK